MLLRRTIDVAPPGAIMVPCLTVIVALWGTMWLSHDIYFLPSGILFLFVLLLRSGIYFLLRVTLTRASRRIPQSHVIRHNNRKVAGAFTVLAFVTIGKYHVYNFDVRIFNTFCGFGTIVTLL
jgi:hypothetical protein